jgi:radical SAM protein with 4Fe4S-binding SPASM domain
MIKKNEEFFLGSPDFFSESNTRINRVNLRGLKGNTEKELRKFRDEQIIKTHSELDKQKWFYKSLITTGINNAMEEAGLRVLSNMTSFSGTCFPGGARLLVDVNGRFQICEKMNPYFSIGDVEKGFDLKKIKSIVEQWQAELIKCECWDCKAWYMCSSCFAKEGGKGSFSIKKENCRKFEDLVADLFVKYLELKEEENNETKVKRSNCDNVYDYLELL